MEGLPAFLLAAVALAGSPGPATLSLTATGAAFGARRGAAYLAGIVVGMVAVMAIVASGLVGLLLAVPGATPAVTVLAANGNGRLRWLVDGRPIEGTAWAPDGTGEMRLAVVDEAGHSSAVTVRIVERP